MSQIALPLVTASSADTVLTGPSLEPVLALLAGASEWPFRAAVLAGPPRSGKSLLARWFAASGLGDMLDDADSLPEDATGWLAGLRDRFVGKALGLMHERPDHPWTVDELAHETGLSRSALHDRFSQFLGQPPMQYLANWRVQLGARMLRETNRNVAAVALDVGYESEAAFSRAFKRLVGAPPAAWRRAQANV